MHNNESIIKRHLVFPDKSTNIMNIYQGQNETPWTLILPGMGIRASYYHQFAKKVHKCYSSTIVTIDYRGFGYSSIRASRKIDFGFKTWLSDMNFIIELMLKESGQEKVNILGHSIGGQLGALFCGRYPDKISRLILVGSSLPYYKIWKWPGKLKLLAGGLLGPMVATIIGYFPGELTGFAGRESRGCMSDWAKVVRTGQYNISKDIFDYEKAMKEVAPKITAISFPEDKLAPPYTVPYLTQKFSPFTEIDEKIIEGFDHFNWTKKVVGFITKANIFGTGNHE